MNGRQEGSLREPQQALIAVCAQLQKLEDRLMTFCDSLPQPGEAFDPLAELRGRVECVLSDLLRDAIMTLGGAATESESQLHRDFLWRREWLAAARTPPAFLSNQSIGGE